MKKLLILVLTFSILISCLALTVGTASAEGATPYEYASGYATAHPRRDILSGGAGAAANTLSAALTAKGYQVTMPEFRYYGESSSGNAKVSYTYNHVIGFKNNGKDKCVVIGCYYDGYEPLDTYGVGNGGSVALSVGTLLYVADALVSASVDYNVVIAFWGGLEIADDLSLTGCGFDFDDVALYVNFDSIAAGDNDYLYADDVPRAQGKYFADIAAEQKSGILEPPAFKKQASLSYESDDVYTYMHLGLVGLNRAFMSEGVPCVSFLGGAWEYDCGLYRYAGKGTIEGTSLDTVADLDALNGGADKTAARMMAVANVVISGVTGKNLSSVLDKAAGETSSKSLNSSLAFYLISFIGTALLFGFLIFLYVKQGKGRREGVWEVKWDVRPGDDPYEEFRDGEAPTSDAPQKPDEEKDGDDNDDVFRF